MGDNHFRIFLSPGPKWQQGLLAPAGLCTLWQRKLLGLEGKCPRVVHTQMRRLPLCSYHRAPRRQRKWLPRWIWDFALDPHSFATTSANFSSIAGDGKARWAMGDTIRAPSK